MVPPPQTQLDRRRRPKQKLPFRHSSPSASPGQRCCAYLPQAPPSRQPLPLLVDRRPSRCLRHTRRPPFRNRRHIIAGASSRRHRPHWSASWRRPPRARRAGAPRDVRPLSARTSRSLRARLSWWISPAPGSRVGPFAVVCIVRGNYD